ncbi:MAG: oatA 1 [Myxococcaceae bacterium]|nr:oatA 1 [Myxococcaceae bacterium]
MSTTSETAATRTLPSLAEVGEPRRNVGLDLLRFIAILLTLMRHMTPEPPASLPPALRGALQVLIHGAWMGVDLFFVLSGFLVSGLLFREFRNEGEVSFTRFFIRRGLRIYPAFFVLLLGYGAIEHVLTRSVTPAHFLSEAFFLQNYLPGLWNHTWSLAVEEHFYITIGLLVALLARTRRGLSTLPAILCATFVLCLTLRMLCFESFAGAVTAQSQFRFDALAFGVLISWLRHFHTEKFRAWTRAKPLLLTLGVALVTPCYMARFDGWDVETWGLTSTYVGCGLMVAAVAMDDRSPGRVSRWLAGLGSHSYSTYLWHMAVKRGFSVLRQRNVLVLPYFGELAAFVIASFLFGSLMSRAVELPVLRLRERYFPGIERRRHVRAREASPESP